MLQEVKIAGCATYSESGERLYDLKQINFIFGANGAGKTTISRVIANPELFPSCALTWQRGQPIEALVYNRDFIDQNYRPQWNGIFTLGKTDGDILARIDAAKNKVNSLETDIAQLEATLGPLDASSGKRGEMRALRVSFEAACWKIKTKYDAEFKAAFSGLRNSQARFCEKVLAESAENRAVLVTLSELTEKASTLFEQGLERHNSIAAVDMRHMLAVEVDDVLSKKVVGKDDVDVAGLIKRLGNSDWVRQGLPYLESGSQCPFCQQEVEADLTARLSAYFDETFEADMARIVDAIASYDISSAGVLKQVEEILAIDSRHIDNANMRSGLDRLAAGIADNRRRLEAKRKEPSAPIALEPLGEIAETLSAQITAANEAIASPPYSSRRRSD